jgi:hypothetical protein
VKQYWQMIRVQYFQYIHLGYPDMFVQYDI